MPLWLLLLLGGAGVAAWADMSASATANAPTPPVPVAPPGTTPPTLATLPTGWSWSDMGSMTVPNVGDNILATLQDPSGNLSDVTGTVTDVSNVQYPVMPMTPASGIGPSASSTMPASGAQFMMGFPGGVPSPTPAETATITFAADSADPSGVVQVGDEFQVPNTDVAPAPPPPPPIVADLPTGPPPVGPPLPFGGRTLPVSVPSTPAYAPVPHAVNRVLAKPPVKHAAPVTLTLPPPWPPKSTPAKPNPPQYTVAELQSLIAQTETDILGSPGFGGPLPPGPARTQLQNELAYYQSLLTAMTTKHVSGVLVGYGREQRYDPMSGRYY